MTRKLAGRRAIDALSLKLNSWAWAGASIVAVTTHCGAAWFVFFLSGAILNLLGLPLCKGEEIYNFRGKLYSQVVRVAQGVGIALACYSSSFRTDRMWLLATPLIISQALIEKSIRKCLYYAVGIGSFFLLCNAAQHGSIVIGLQPLALLSVAAGVAGVLTKYREREELLDVRNRRMSTLMATASAVAARDIKTTISQALRSTVQDLGATAGIVTLVAEEDARTLMTEAAFSTRGEFDFPETLQVGSGLAGYVVKMGQPISIHASQDESLDCDGIGLDAHAAVSVPLMTRGGTKPGQAYEEQAIGALTLVFCEAADSVDHEDLALLQSLSSLLGAAVSNQRMEERQRLTFLRTLESLATALEARDDYTRGHSHRVCELSILIGQGLGFGSDAVEELRIGTTLHDIGKIGVPDAILNKPGRLTDEEFATMREHPVIGYEICRPLMLSEGVLMIIRNHHEKLDGSGYPDGLKGGELPLSLRIVCVADAFDAMSSRRPYRGVMDIQHVLAELGKGAGIQFDPVVVETLRNLLQAGNLDELYRQFWSPSIREAA